MKSTTRVTPIMFSRHATMTVLVMLSIAFLHTTSTVNGLALSNEGNNNDVQATNYTIGQDAVIMHSLLGDIQIPIPEDIKAELNRRKNEGKTFERLTLFGESEFNHNYPSSRQNDFFECMEKSNAVLAAHTESYQSWSIFFKRNKFSDTMAVRYCCNLLEYAEILQQQLPLECQSQIRFQDKLMVDPQIRATCRQYDIHTVECFLVSWMYWWIPIVSLILIMLILMCICCAMKRSRSRAYLKTREEDKRFRTSLVNGTAI